MARKTGWKNATIAKGGPGHGKGKAFSLACPPPLWRFGVRPTFRRIQSRQLTPTLGPKMSKPKSTPLWQAMAEACANHPDGVVDLRPAVIHAMILAARDWLVPDEEPYEGHLRGLRAGMETERQALREILTAEAERAERGE